AWGVEYTAVRQGNHLLIPLINFLPEVQTVRLDLPGVTEATDLISGEKIDLRQIRLPSIEPRLLKVSR
ncbi:MAG: hypothetical protein V4671_05750, partial [Armatimonadota bacterium]